MCETAGRCQCHSVLPKQDGSHHRHPRHIRWEVHIHIDSLIVSQISECPSIDILYIYQKGSHTPPPPQFSISKLGVRWSFQGQTATSHQPFHPGLCMWLSRGRLPPVINHSTLAYVCDYPGADCHQSSTIPSWPMYVTIQGQTATSHQPFHPGLCVWLSRGRLPPVINHSTLAYVCHYPGADCHQSSTIPPWPMCVTIQGQTATCHQSFHPGLCVSLSRCRLPPVINHSTLAYVCHYPGADCHQSSTIPPWPMCVTIQVQTATGHQPFHPGLCVSLSRGRLPPVINHSTLAYVCQYPGADCHQSSTIPPWPMCVTTQGQQIGQNSESLNSKHSTGWY